MKKGRDNRLEVRMKERNAMGGTVKEKATVDGQNIKEALKNFRTRLVQHGINILESSIYVSEDEEAQMSLYDIVQRSRVLIDGKITKENLSQKLTEVSEVMKEVKKFTVLSKEENEQEPA